MKKILSFILASSIIIVLGGGVIANAASGDLESTQYNKLFQLDNIKELDNDNIIVERDVVEYSKKVINKGSDFIYKIMATVAVLVVIYSGFLMVVARGDDSKIKKAESAVLYAIVGMVVIAFSWSIVTVVVNIVAGS